MSGHPQDPYEHIAPMPPPPSAPAQVGYQAPRPGTVTAAAVLWICDGVLLTVAFGFEALRAYGIDGDVTRAAVAVVLTVGAALIWRFGSRLRFGHDNRVTLTVLGALSGLGIVTLIFVVPAIVLQYLPASRQWFALPPADSGRAVSGRADNGPDVSGRADNGPDVSGPDVSGPDVSGPGVSGE